MGTRFEFVLVGDGEARLRAAGEDALAEVRDEEARWSLFAKDSLTSLWNREAFRRPMALDEDALEFMIACKALHRETGGAFDPGIGRRMEALGFRPDSPRDGAGDPMEPFAGSPGLDGVEIDPEAASLRFLDPRVSLDFGGIGKGQALDRAAGVLMELGVTTALLHGGTSTVVALGAPPDRDGWSIALADGLASDEAGTLEGSTSVPVVVLRDGCLSVSAPRGRRSECASHLVDPRSGASVVEERTAATVAAAARSCDAWSTALCVDPTLLDALPGGMSGLVTSTSDPRTPTSSAWRVRRHPEHTLQLPDSPRTSPEVRTA